MQSAHYPEIKLALFHITGENCAVSGPVWITHQMMQTHHLCLLEVVSSGRRCDFTLSRMIAPVPGLTNSSYLKWVIGQVLQNCNIVQQISYHARHGWCFKWIMQYSGRKLCQGFSKMLIFIQSQMWYRLEKRSLFSQTTAKILGNKEMKIKSDTVVMLQSTNCETGHPKLFSS